MDEQERQTLSNSTHLTPAEAGHLLGSSPARVREMIRRGELTQERVADRWLIPVADVNRILNPSPAPRDHKKHTLPHDQHNQRPKHNKKQRQGELPQSTSLSSSPQSISKVPAQKTRELAGEIERLGTRMKQIDGELRVLRSGLLNDEKRERIEKLKTEKRKHGKNLQKLQTELSRRENRQEQRF